MQHQLEINAALDTRKTVLCQTLG